MPRTIRLVIFLIINLGWPGKILFSSYLLSLITYNKQIRAFDVILEKSGYWWHFVGVELAIIVFFLLVVKLIIAKWHGAEHMAIEAYNKRGSTDINDIFEQSPVHPKCGGRIFIPMISVVVFSVYISRWLQWNTTLIFWFLFEIVLWIDKFIGFDRIFPFAQASVLFQSYITTQKPGDREVLTAQKAIMGLVSAHAQGEN